MASDLFPADAVERVAKAAPIAAKLARLRSSRRVKTLHASVVAYAEATADVARLLGPWDLRGFGEELEAARTCGELFARFDAAPFPALRIGGDRRGIDFWLELASGRVITLHHDASFSEEAAKCGGKTVAAFAAQLVERGAAFDVLQLARLQVALRAVPAATELERQESWTRTVAEVLGVNLAELARRIGYLPYELLHLEQQVVEELAAAPKPAKKAAKAKRVAPPRPLAEALATGARTLDLAGLLDGRLPAAITELTALEELDLSANPRLDFADAFETLAALPRLRVVKFADCRLEALPESLAKLSALEELDLSSSLLKGPHNFFALDDALPILRRLPTLRVLNASVCRAPADVGAFVAALPAIERLTLDSLQSGFWDTKLTCDGSPTLEALSARALNLDALIDTDPARFPRLRTLNLERTTLSGSTGDDDATDEDYERVKQERIAKLVDWVVRLPALRELDLRVKTFDPDDVSAAIAKLRVEELWLQCTAMPAWIGEITTLRRLHVRYVREPLPAAIGELANLEVLDLGGEGGEEACRLTTLPDEIGRLAKLRELIAGAQIERWPDALRSCSALERLHSRDAGPPFLRELTSLRRSTGAISELVHLPRLERIELSGATRIPAEIANHPALREVRWWAYAVEADLDASLERVLALPALETLELAYLQRATLPAALGKAASLRSLSLHLMARDQPKLDLDAVVALLATTRIEKLSLAIDYPLVLPEALGDLRTLQHLDLRGLGISKLPASLAKLPALRRIDLRQTKVGAPERKRLRALGCRVEVWDW